MCDLKIKIGQESTVRAHIFHIQQRLGMENRGQIVAYAHNVFLKD